MRCPRVSVGMPVYNSGQWISDSIESLLKQTFDDFELIISDNASTDETEALCREFAERDQRIRYYRNKENIGASDNYNSVFRHSTGMYFKWASSNDLCDPNFLLRCVEVLDSRPDVVLAYPKTRLFVERMEDGKDYEDGLDLQESTPCFRFTKLLRSMHLNNVMNGLVRSDVLGKTPLIKTFFSSDVNLMAELALHGKFSEIPEYLFYRRMDPATATKLKSDEEVLKHYNPDQKSPMLFQSWKITLEYFSAVSRTKLPPNEKACLYRFLVRYMIWNRTKLAADIKEALRSSFSRR